MILISYALFAIFMITAFVIKDYQEFGAFCGMIGVLIFRHEKRKFAGEEGKIKVQALADKLPKDTFDILYDVEVPYDNKMIYIDTVIIGQKEVFMIISKNLNGEVIRFGEDTWTLEKLSRKVKTYTTSIKSPLKKANFWTHVLSNYIKENGCYAWCNSYVMMYSSNWKKDNIPNRVFIQEQDLLDFIITTDKASQKYIKNRKNLILLLTK